MPNVYLTDSQLEQVANLLHDEAENGEDLLEGESKELANLAEDMIRKIGDEDEEVDIQIQLFTHAIGQPVVSSKQLNEQWLINKEQKNEGI